jgi:hypothetical protein
MMANFCSWLDKTGVLGHTMLLTTDNATWHALNARGFPVVLDRVFPERQEYRDGKGSAPDTPNRWAVGQRGRRREGRGQQAPQGQCWGGAGRHAAAGQQPTPRRQSLHLPACRPPARLPRCPLPSPLPPAVQGV